MPRTIPKVDELKDSPITPDQQVGRYFHLSDGLKIGMGRGVKLIAEKLLDCVATELAGRKTYIVYDQK